MINPIASEVGTAVLAAIQEAGRTKLSVSDETGIPYPTLNRKVAGKSEFSFSELAMVAESLGVSPARFTPTAFSRAREASVELEQLMGTVDSSAELAGVA